MSELVARLSRDYPQFNFAMANRARWSTSEQTIYCTDDDMQTLHELGHALCGHNHYVQDIELLSIERAAWDRAIQLAPQYDIRITEDVVEDALDSYRDWLHARSKCPHCDQTGLQSHDSLDYYCPNCGTTWTASDGKCRHLKRTIKH